MVKETIDNEILRHNLNTIVEKFSNNLPKRTKNPDYKQIRVFISSTKKDLEKEREAVNTLVEEMGFTLATMEKFGARPESPLETCLHELDDANIYVCILGMKYGTSYKNQDEISFHEKSYTEIEYNRVFSKYLLNKDSIRILVYCIDEENAKIPPKFVDTGDDARKLETFKTKVKENHTVFFYQSTSHLVRRLEFDLENQAQYILNQNKQDKQESTSDKSYITIATSAAVIYFHQPLRISGVALNTPMVYLHLQKGGMESISESNFLPMKKDGTTCIPVMVENDHTWSYTWDLNDLIGKFEAGGYSIVASSTPDLTEETTVYTASFIEIKSGFLVVYETNSILIQGITSHILGSALTKCPYLYLWFCSSDKLIDKIRINVEKDDSYKYVFPPDLLSRLSPGEQYFGILQMPVKDELGSVRLINENEHRSIVLMGKNGVESKRIDLGSENNFPRLNFILGDLLDESEDLYVRLSYLYDIPRVTNLTVNYNSKVLDVSGYTNLPIDTELFIDLLSVKGRFSAIAALNEAMFEPVLERVKVVRGDSTQSFSKRIHTNYYLVGEYQLNVRLPSGQIIASKTFSV